MSSNSTDTTSSTSSVSTTSLTLLSTVSTTSTTSTTTSSTSTSTSSTSTPSTTSSSSSATTSTTSSTTGVVTTASSPSTTNATTSSSSSASTPSLVVSTSTDAQGGLVTITVTSNARNVPSQTGVGSGSSGDSSFFDNTSAVAGTFAAVGIVALGLLILIVTVVIRRRRAKKWDDEVAAAAAEAANSRVPVFLDDPLERRYGDNNNDHGYSGVAPSVYPGSSAPYAPTGYNNVGNHSDVSSHGTYGQPAMSHEGQYPEMSGPVPGGIFDHNAAYAGAAGIGVARARSRGAETMASANTRNTGPSGVSDYHSAYAAGVGENGSPYPAFLAPGGYDMYKNAANQYHINGSDQQLIHNPVSPGPEGGTTHANAMASVAAAAAAGSGTGSTEQTPGSESYASHYEPGFSGSGSPNRTDGASRSPDVSGRPSIDNLQTRREELPNPFTSGIESDDESDGEEEVPGRRVLKVANE
ncbi:hypothetical protein E1B28_004701 [Marasmius oreades]|uniref:Uncharacterized protein n=1 Tax=Marasmius oreades TaxID=181124 RepID=A0A9P7UZ50_9AGAR|nr:uncharacterized protein E1B28_004701 [Marasmius oreades]KAG7097345.1 hypothetical protein E1B28_004701 [Marasmius oreades]